MYKRLCRQGVKDQESERVWQKGPAGGAPTQPMVPSQQALNKGACVRTWPPRAGRRGWRGRRQALVGGALPQQPYPRNLSPFWSSPCGPYTLGLWAGGGSRAAQPALPDPEEPRGTEKEKLESQWWMEGTETQDKLKHLVKAAWPKRQPAPCVGFATSVLGFLWTPGDMTQAGGVILPSGPPTKGKRKTKSIKCPGSAQIRQTRMFVLLQKQCPRGWEPDLPRCIKQVCVTSIEGGPGVWVQPGGLAGA